MISVGSVIKFKYNGKNRLVKVEHIATQKRGIFNPIRFVRGWDLLADSPVGGWRSFNPDKMTNVAVLG